MDPESERAGIFRHEAVAHYLRDADSPGLLRTGPLWTRTLTLVTAALLISALAFLVLAMTVVVTDARRVPPGQTTDSGQP